ncbi:hypothetical protein [Pantoea agglomerans]|uniref:hypothetical protein n=1 Tax=Enterobacter agglomerans TaxID=549 RepID=UPI002413565D|nr:hypothetical protein [Pantoea agglomerans]
MQQHMKVKELVAAAHAAAPDLPPAAAQLMREVASRLDVTFVALSEAMVQRDALAAENAYLLPKAASELSNAWVLHKYWVGIQAALMHLRVGRIYEVEEWLQNTIAGPGIEAPNHKLTEEIDAWANEQSKDSISHSRALEIIKAETPATDAYLNSVRAEAVQKLWNDSLNDVGHMLRDIGAFRDASGAAGIVHDEIKERVEEFASQLRAGKDGE